MPSKRPYPWTKEANRERSDRRQYRRRSDHPALNWPECNWSFPPAEVDQLKIAITEAISIVPWFESLFAFTRYALPTVKPFNVTRHNAPGILEDVVLAWADIYQQVHPGSALRRDDVLGRFAEHLRSMKSEAGETDIDKAITSARNPSCWPDVDDDYRIRHVSAIAIALARFANGQFFLPCRTVVKECQLKYPIEGRRILVRMEHEGLLVDTGERTKLGSVCYRLGPRLANISLCNSVTMNGIVTEGTDIIISSVDKVYKKY